MIQKSIAASHSEMKKWPVELKLLLTCLSIWPDDNYAPLEIFSRLPIDGNSLLALSKRHKVFPIVYAVMNRQSIVTVDDNTMHGFRRLCRKNVLHTMAMTRVLCQVIKRLEKEGIPAIALKGAVLGKSLYGDACLRPCRDIDMLIHPSYVPQTNRLLVESGFRLIDPKIDFDNTRLVQRALEELQHVVYECPKTGVVLEIHWRLNRKQVCLLTYGALPVEFERCQKLSVADVDIYHFEKIENLLYCCVHGSFHGWYRLKWLHDVALQLRDVDACEWPRIIEEAEKREILHLLIQSCILVHSLLDVPLPPFIDALNARSADVQRHVKLALAMINAPDEITGAKLNKGYVLKKMNFLACNRKMRYQLKFVAGLFQPTLGDYETLCLPDSLFPLYWLLRPVLWGFRRLEIEGVTKQ